MGRERKTSGRRDAAGDRVPLELPPDRAFVLHLDSSVRSRGYGIGRIEHVSSGRVSSLRELVAFLTDVLRDEAPEASRETTAPAVSRRRARARG